MRKALVFFLMQNKRIFKDPFLIALFLALPLIILLMSGAVSENDRLIRAAVYTGDDEAARSAAMTLAGSSEIIGFVFTDSKEEALSLTEEGKTDAAFVFLDDYRKKTKLLKEYESPKLIECYAPEDNPLLRLLIFRLYVSMYPDIMHDNYSEILKELDDVGYSEELAEKIWELNTSDESLFEMRYVNNEKAAENGNPVDSSMRGLLALSVLLLAFSGALKFMRDDRNGVYGLIPVQKKGHVRILCISVPAFYGMVLLAVVMFLSEKMSNIPMELLNGVIYFVNTVLFVYLLSLIVKKEEWLAALIPPVILMTAVLCPVFIPVKNVRFLQVLFPEFFYLSSVHNMSYTIGALIISFVFCTAGFVLPGIINKVRKTGKE